MTARGHALVLRPAGRGEALARSLQQAGWRTTLAPLMEFAAGPDLPQLATELGRLQPNDLLLAVSPSLLPWVATAAPPPWPAATRIAVGATTAAALTAAGCGQWQFPPVADSDGVLALPGCQQGEGRRALLLRGERGRTLIADTLRQRGFALIELCCYRRLPLAPSAEQLTQWQSDGIDTLILTSAEALDILLTHSNNRQQQWLGACQWLVASPRLAAWVSERLGAARVSVADGADDQSLISLALPSP